jgi:hypothetical protein
MPHWEVGGLPRSKVPVSGVLAADGMIGEATRRVLHHAKFLAKDRPVGTLEFLSATISTDSADWTGFTVACETGEPRLPGTVDETALGTVTVDLDQNAVTVTVPLAKAMHRGQQAAVQLHDEVLLPQHVVLAILADDRSAAAQWLGGHKTAAAAGWRHHLSDRIFGTDISNTSALLGEPMGRAPMPVHDQQMTGATITDPKTVTVHGLKWRIPALVAAVLLLLPGSTAFATGLHRFLYGQGALGIVTAPASRPGATIVTILPGSPAQRAGFHVGDVIISVAGTSVGSVAAAGLAIRSYGPGAHVPVTVLRNGRRATLPVVLGDPVSLNHPGYLGVTVANSPQGATVTAVATGSPAAAVGLEPGDLITAVSGYPDGGSALGTLLLIESHHPGQTIRLSVVTGDRGTSINATLAQSP